MTDRNPFDDIPTETASVNPFDQINDTDPDAAQSSTFGALARGAAGGTLPAVGGIAAAARGARLGAMAGALIPGLGETGIGEAGGAIVGGLIGGFGGGWAAGKAQDYAISKLPDAWKDPIEAQEKADVEQHPYASFAGGLVPFALTMSPGSWARQALPANATAMQRLMAHPATAHLFGGAVQGGIELGQEAITGDYDWRKLAMSTGFGLVFNSPNRLGRYIEGERGPTIAQAHDTKVAGEGVTEEVFQGTQEQDQHSAMAAQDAARAEAPEQPQHDLHAVARRMEPELFAQWDELNKRRDSFRRWIGELEDPAASPVTRAHLRATEDELGELQPQVAAAYRRAADHAGAETVEPAKFRSLAEMIAANDQGRAPGAAPVNAAIERSPEQAQQGAEVSAPVAVASETPAPVQPQVGSPVSAKPIAEQEAFIANDVTRQLIAAGRPRDEAEVSGKLIAARYVTRAGLFHGALGSAEELYRREGARIIGPGGKAPPSAPVPPASPKGQSGQGEATQAAPAEGAYTGPKGPTNKNKPVKTSKANGEPLSLISFLAENGGLRPDPEIDALDMNAGLRRRLVWKGGMSLSDAQQLAEEKGYMGYIDPEAQHPFSKSDFIDKLDDSINGGRKVYPYHREGEVIEKEQQKAVRNERLQMEDLAQNALEDGEHGIPGAWGTLSRREQRELAERVTKGEDAHDVFEELAIRAENNKLTGVQRRKGDVNEAEQARVSPEGGEPAQAGGGRAEPGGEAGHDENSAEVRTSGTEQEATGERAGEVAPQFEAGAEGKPQQLIPGVEPVTDRDKLQAQANAPMRGGNADLQFDGLFGDAHKQGDLLAPIATPMPEHPTEIEAEAVKRAADPEPQPEEQVQKDIEATAPEVVVEEPEPADPAQDAYADKWFGSKEKAEAFIAKKDIGATHEVVSNGTKFRIKPKPEEKPLPESFVERIPGPEDDGTEVLIFKNSDGERFNVVLRDKDAQDTVGVTIVKDMERARAEAQKMLHGPKAEPAAQEEGKPRAPTAPNVAKPTAERPYADEGNSFHAGLADAREGKPRDLPSYFTKPTGKNARDWFRGYDAAKKESAKPNEPITDRKGREWTPIGKNADGLDLFEDHRGVRSYVRDGMRYVEPVTIDPRSGFSTNRAIHPEYEIAPEKPAEPAPKEKPTKQAEKSTQAAHPPLWANAEDITREYADRLYDYISNNEALKTETGVARLQLAGDIRKSLDMPGMQRASEAVEDMVGSGWLRMFEDPETGGEKVALVEPKPTEAAQQPIDETTQPAENTAAPIEEPANEVQQQPGEAVRGGTQDVPEGSAPAPAPKPKPIRGPRKASAFGGRDGKRNAPGSDGETQQQQGNAEPAASEEAGVVTKPPAIGAGDGEERPDTPAETGIKSARERIAKRSRSNYRITDDDQIGVGTPKQKINANIEAIRVLKTLEDEARDATPEEKAVLVKYTGWGAFAQDMFAPNKSTFKTEREAFRALVNDAEYKAARESTLNAHYTSPDVIKGMWDAITHFGYDGGLAIEPSAGIGHFIGLTPDGIAPRTAWTAVELDSLTGRIAKALYGGAEVNVQGFETLKRPSNYYDLAISNVPFGDYIVKEKPYGAHSVHNFFFLKSIDKVRPGGVVAFITSRYTMDSLDPGIRRMLAKSADLVGSIRLPGGNKGAFAGNAGTAVTTDILFLRKRIPEETPFPGANWMDVKEIQTPEGPTKINEYFADKPEMMLGEMRLTSTQYTDKEPVLIGEAEGLREKIAEAARKMPEGAFTVRQAPPPAPIHANDIEGNVKEGGFFLKDGKLYRKSQGQGVEHSLSAQEHDRVTRLTGLRDIVNDLLSTQIMGGESATQQADHLRDKLRTAYDAFVAKHGPINKEVRTVTSRIGKNGEPVTVVRRPNISEFAADPDGYKVAAIENYDPETGKAERASIQTKDVISPPTKRQINGPSDAVAAVLDQKGRIDLQTIGDMLGAKTEDEVVARLGDLIYQNPDGRQWEPADKYLSGDVLKKLEEARELAKSEPAYLRNVTALEKVQPTPLEPHDIVAQFGAPWIPEDTYKDFLTNIGGSNVEVKRVPITGEWKTKIAGWSRDALSKFGTDRTKVGDIVDAALNNRQVTVYDQHSDGTRSVNQPATEQARVKVEALKEAFTGDQDAGIDGWIWGDQDRSEQLAAIYNRTFNNLAQRKFDGVHQTFPGMNILLKLRQHQIDAVWRIVQAGNTLLAHVVGAGKTFTMIAAGMEQKRLGLINKPMYVVPNHMLEQFSREFLQAYPDAKILVAQKDEMTSSARKSFIAKVAANDWDGIIITHDAFGRINMARDFRERYVRDQLDELEQIRRAEAEDSGAKSPTVKALEKVKKNLEAKLETLLNEERKDEGTTFEETGVDHVVVDEAHKFKNLSFITRLQRVKGLSQGNSQRAEDLFLKLRYLEQKRPGRSAVFATGTPVSNTMAEIWTMMRYLELDKLKERGLDNFDSWASTFGKVVNNMELGADGRSFKEVSSFSKFVNVPELISLYSEIADTRTADMLKLPRPEVKTRNGAPGVEIVQAEPSAQEEAFIEHLVKRAEEMKGKPPMKGQPNMLSIVTAGRKVATDGRLIKTGDLDFGGDEPFEFNPNGKVAKAVDNISRIYKEGNASGAAKAQMVFLDMGVPSSKSRSKKPRVIDDDDSSDPAQTEEQRINLYDDIKQRLIAEGVPAKEIAFIHDAGDDAKKAALFAKVRSGEVRVILGSSEKMGVGTNVQRLLIAMHHLDAPWKPAEVEQRDGRIVRQGNLNPEVQIYRYVTKRSFDAFMWQKLDTKSKFITQVLSGAKGSRHAEDIDSPLPEAAEMKAAASGDPRIMEHAELSRQVRQLQSQKRAFDTTVSRATWELNAAKSRIEQWEGSIASAKADAARVTDISGDKFAVKLGDKAYDSRKEAGQSIVNKLAGMNPAELYRPKDYLLGEMSGFEMRLEMRGAWSQDSSYLSARPYLVGEGKYSSTDSYVLNSQTDPVGLMRKFENLLGRIAQQPDNLDAALAGERKSVEKLSATLQTKWPREQEYANAQQKLADLVQAMKPKEEKPQEIKPETEYSQGASGSIRFNSGNTRAIIRLAANADASTFIHESGHDFLEQIKRDAAHEAAPDQLRKDWETTKSWLGAADGNLKTKHHEKFARGFEQYMREGIAPSKGLAGIFARFKTWLLSVYQTIKGLGSPINDDIRGVFDRLLAEEPQRTVIAPDVERGKTLAGLHEEEAATTPPAEAEPAMARVENEAERHEQELHPEVTHELAPAIAKIEAERQPEQPTAANDAGPESAAGAAEASGLGAGSRGPEPVAGAGARGEEPGKKLGGGGGAGREGGGVPGPEQRPIPGQDTGNGKASNGSGVPYPGPATTFEPAEPKFVDKAGNIRIDNLTTREDVAQAIRDAAERNDDFIGDRRGVISDGQVMELADALGMNVAELSARKLGQAFNAEQIMAARKLLIQSATNVSALMKKAAAGTDEDVMAYAIARDRHQMIQAQVAGITAEAGRALRAFHSITGQEGAQAVDQFIKQATGKTLFQMRQEAKLGAQLETPQQVSKFMHDAEKRGFSSSLLEYWINGLISGPATHTTYMIGNMLLALEKSGPETALAAGIGAARRAMGREGPTVRAGEVGAQMRAMSQGLAPALKSAADALHTGATTLLPGEKAFDQSASSPFTWQVGQPEKYDANASYHDAMESSFAIARGIRDGFVSGAALLKAGGIAGEPTWGRRYAPGGAIPDYTYKGVGVAPVGTLIRGPSRFIAAIHSLFRSINYSMEKGALAYRQASEEGHEGMQLAQRAGELYTNPPSEIMQQSVHEATELTLMSKGGEFTNALSKLTNTQVFGLPLFKFVDPFVRISSNIIEQSLLKRTPMGLLSGEIRRDLAGENGTISQDRATARMMAGTALCVGFGTLAAQGLVSGSGPKDQKKAAMWRLAGNQPHSVRIGDTWYDMHRLGPLGMLIGMSADLYDVIHKVDEGKGEEAAAHLLHAVTQNILDESFMRGPAELIQAIEDPDRHGQSYIQNFLASFTPYSVGMSQIARATDPYSRQAGSIIDAIKRKVPGMSEELLPRRDIWGEAMPSADAVIAPGVTALYMQKISTDPVNLAMLRLGIAPAQVSRHIRNVELTDQERDDYSRVAGRMAKMNLDRIVQSPMFSNWPPHVQHDVIVTTIRQSREAASGMIMMKYPHILRDAAQNKLKKIRGEDINEIE